VGYLNICGRRELDYYITKDDICTLVACFLTAGEDGRSRTKSHSAEVFFFIQHLLGHREPLEDEEPHGYTEPLSVEWCEKLFARHLLL
jgi:hypothetical protein